MSLPFWKYQGAGNDFVMLYDPGNRIDRGNHERIHQWCHRRFGIGADGVIILQPHEEVDFTMHYFNADGYPGSMCGNGGRCAILLAHRLGLCEGHCQFETSDGWHDGRIADDGMIHLKMADVSDVEAGADHYILDTGSPHFVTFDPVSSGEELLQRARDVRYSQRFADTGINVNFVDVVGRGELRMRTYERGVEAETYACGTGAVAAAISAFLSGNQPEQPAYTIHVNGGTLHVRFEVDTQGLFKHIWLIGPAKEVFKGELPQ